MKFSASAVVLALAATASAQQMDPCINKSIVGAGCAGATDIKCICKGSASGSFLTDVLTQLVQYCPKTVDPSGLFSTLTSACKGAGIEIPAQNVADAQQLAGSVFGGNAGGANGGANAGSSSAAPTAHGSVGAPIQASPTGKPSSANAGSPTSIGDSTAVISVPTGGADAGSGAGSAGTLITSPTTTPNAGSGSGSSNASGFTTSSQAASPSGTAAAGSNGTNAGVRTGASMGAAVLGLAAAVMIM